MPRALLAALAILASALFAAPAAQAYELPVTAVDTPADLPATAESVRACAEETGPCSLRIAVAMAGQNLGAPGAEGLAISMPPGNYLLNGPITVPETQVNNPTTHERVPIRIFGAGAGQTSIGRNLSTDGLFVVPEHARLVLDDLTLQGGYARKGGVATGGEGGAIHAANKSWLTLSNVRALNNEADEGGGAIIMGMGGHLAITGSLFAGNHLTGRPLWLGGAIVIGDGAEASITDSTFEGNSVPLVSCAGCEALKEVPGRGGAISFGQLTLLVRGSTFVGNSASVGSAIDGERGRLDMQNSTVTANEDLTPGGASVRVGSARISGSTITGDSGPGPDLAAQQSSPETEVTGSILGSCEGTVNLRATLIRSPRTCAFLSTGDVVGADPKLGPLAANGGPTRTMAITRESPAAGLVPAELCLPVDQRGLARPHGSSCSAGAYEPPGAGGAPGGGPPGPGGAPRPSPVAPPKLTGLAIAHSRFRVGSRPTAIAAAAPVGTAFRFTLNTRATVQIRISQPASGLRSGRRCLAVTPALRRGHARRCTRTLVKGMLTRADQPAGTGSVAFSGRIGTRPLAPGSYDAAIVASNAAGRTIGELRFTIVR